MRYKIRLGILTSLIVIIIGSSVWQIISSKNEDPFPQTNITQIKTEEYLKEDLVEDAIETKKDNLFEENKFVENYIRENINEIAINKPILGGTWYVTSIKINEDTSYQPVLKSGKVQYEDGHIVSEATFIYSTQKEPREVKIHEFIIKE